MNDNLKDIRNRELKDTVGKKEHGTVYGNLAENKAKATLVLETLPAPQQISGKFPVRYIHPETKEFSYIYKDITTEMVEHQANLGGTTNV